MATAHQLYPPSRIAEMSTTRLRRVLDFATVDAKAAWVVYDGMTRADTQATAQRTVADVSAALRGRIAE